MKNYQFNLIPATISKPLSDNTCLEKRPFIDNNSTFEKDAQKFIAGDQLADAMNTAIAVGKPLLLTGEPGTGKTQAAYFAARHLNVKCFHFQVKSDSTARDLLYDFDMVQYFGDAHLKRMQGAKIKLDKRNYIQKRPFWKAIDCAKEKKVPQILLIDEIDKAPRDFPNDLLHELDQMEFSILDTDQKIAAPPHLRPIVFITSNSERRLPDPFLRRCVYHHIVFNDDILRQIVYSRKKEFSNLDDDCLEKALNKFLDLRDKPLRKKPATSELLLWLNVLSLSFGNEQQQLKDTLINAKLPYLNVLLKDHQDIEEI